MLDALNLWMVSHGLLLVCSDADMQTLRICTVPYCVYIHDDLQDGRT